MILPVLQDRMSSTRLPGKVMAEVAGQPMLLRQIERLRRCERLDGILVATSMDPSDDALAAFLALSDIPLHRGPLDDVLARYDGAIQALALSDIVVRLTGDCPL